MCAPIRTILRFALHSCFVACFTCALCEVVVRSNCGVLFACAGSGAPLGMLGGNSWRALRRLVLLFCVPLHYRMHRAYRVRPRVRDQPCRTELVESSTLLRLLGTHYSGAL